MDGKKESIISGRVPIYKTPPTDGLPKVGWDVDRFERLIYQQGYDVDIDRALVCPCRDKTSGSALSTCKNCLGRGWFFVDRTQTRIIGQSMDNKRRHEKWTSADTGIGRFTSRAIDKLNYMDRIILKELEAFRAELLRPHVDDEGELIAYPIYEPINVTNIFLFIGDATKLLPIPDSMYQVDGNLIRFDKSLLEEVPVTDLNQSEPQLSISIRYNYHPVYHVLEANRELMKVRAAANCYTDEQLRSMPINVIARKAHYMFGAQEWGNELFDNTVVPEE